MIGEPTSEMEHKRGLTLIELIVVIGLTAFLVGAIVFIGNPGSTFAGARNSERQSHVTALALVIRQNIADNRTGTFTCASGQLPATSTRMAANSPFYNIAPCLIPQYLATMPFDPSASGAHYTNLTDYDTSYEVLRSATSGEVTVRAPFAELGKSISVTQ